MSKYFKLLIGLFTTVLVTGCSFGNSVKEDGGVIKVGLIADTARNRR